MPGQAEVLVARAPHAALIWLSQGGLMVVNGVLGDVCIVSMADVRVLEMASTPIAPEELAVRAGVSREVVDRLIECHLLIDPSFTASYGNWSTFELITQWMALLGGPRDELDWSAVPPMRRGAWSRNVIDVPRPAFVPAARMFDVLGQRRSHRCFASSPMRLEQLTDFLYLTSRVEHASPSTGDSRRPYPSAGGRHPLEIYVAALEVRDLPRGIYWYDPFELHLCQLEVDAERLLRLRDEVGRGLGPGLKGRPSAVLIVTAMFDRTLWMYHDTALTLVYKDVGCLVQTWYLAATALGLAGCATQGSGEMASVGWLGLDPREEGQVSWFVLGCPVSDSP